MSNDTTTTLSYTLSLHDALPISLITGDGTGPELAAAARKCIDATGVKINWDVQEAGVEVMAKNGGNPLPDATMRSEEHTSELQSQSNLVCRLLLEKKNIERRVAH